MDERAEPERIEVALTTAATGDRVPERSIVLSSDGVATADDAPSSPWRPPTAVTMLATAALALAIGVLIGRAGRDAPVPTATPPTSVAAPVAAGSIETDPGLLTLPTAPDLAGASAPTTRPPAARRPTFPGEADHGAGSAPIVALAPQLVDLGIELVLLTSTGELVTLDVGTGQVGRRELDVRAVAAPGIHAGQGWLLVRGGALDGRALLVHDEGATEPVVTGWPLLVVDGTDRYWRPPIDPASWNAATLEETSLLDGPTGRTLEALGDPLAADPLTGGVVVDAPGGVFVVSSSGPQRVTPGELVALGREHALARECDDRLVCDYVVVDRADGARRALSLDRSGWSTRPSCGEPTVGRRCALGERVTLQALSWWTLPSPMGPRERRVLVAAWDPFGAEDPGQGFVDLESGAFTLVAPGIVPMAWGPEGELVFYLDGGRLTAFVVATGETIDVVPDLDRLEAFTWRASAPPVDDG